MPNYPNASGSSTLPPPPNSLSPGDTYTFFNAEQPAPPQASIEVAIGPRDGAPAAGMVFEILFSGAPGAFSLQIQEADATDADIFYVTPTNPAYTVTAVNSNNVATTDLIPTGGKFLRVLLSSRANAVNVTVKGTRVQ